MDLVIEKKLHIKKRGILRDKQSMPVSQSGSRRNRGDRSMRESIRDILMRQWGITPDGDSKKVKEQENSSFFEDRLNELRREHCTDKPESPDTYGCAYDGRGNPSYAEDNENWDEIPRPSDPGLECALDEAQNAAWDMDQYTDYEQDSYADFYDSENTNAGNYAGQGESWDGDSYGAPCDCVSPETYHDASQYQDPNMPYAQDPNMPYAQDPYVSWPEGYNKDPYVQQDNNTYSAQTEAQTGFEGPYEPCCYNVQDPQPGNCEEAQYPTQDEAYGAPSYLASENACEGGQYGTPDNTWDPDCSAPLYPEPEDRIMYPDANYGQEPYTPSGENYGGEASPDPDRSWNYSQDSEESDWHKKWQRQKEEEESYSDWFTKQFAMQAESQEQNLYDKRQGDWDTAQNMEQATDCPAQSDDYDPDLQSPSYGNYSNENTETDTEYPVQADVNDSEAQASYQQSALGFGYQTSSYELYDDDEEFITDEYDLRMIPRQNFEVKQDPFQVMLQNQGRKEALDREWSAGLAALAQNAVSCGLRFYDSYYGGDDPKEEKPEGGDVPLELDWDIEKCVEVFEEWYDGPGAEQYKRANRAADPTENSIPKEEPDEDAYQDFYQSEDWEEDPYEDYYVNEEPVREEVGDERSDAWQADGGSAPEQPPSHEEGTCKACPEAESSDTGYGEMSGRPEAEPLQYKDTDATQGDIEKCTLEIPRAPHNTPWNSLSVAGSGGSAGPDWYHGNDLGAEDGEERKDAPPGEGPDEEQDSPPDIGPYTYPYPVCEAGPAVGEDEPAGFNLDKMQAFLSFHYPDVERYKGFVPIVIKSQEEEGVMKACEYFPMGEVGAGAGRLFYIKNRNYYITANSFKIMDRKQENLLSCHNFVLDLDNHSGEPILNNLRKDFKGQFISAAKSMNFPAGFPLPNSIVFSGRGFQLWWAVEQFNANADWIYDDIITYLADCAGKILEFLSLPLKVDLAASKNRSGLFRLPGTFNVKAQVWGSFERIHSERIESQPFYEKIKPIMGGKQRDNAFYENTPKKHPDLKKSNKHENLKEAKRTWVEYHGRSAEAVGRADKIVQLLKLRQGRGVTSAGEMRDLFLFCIHCILSGCMPIEEVHNYLRSVNSMFIHPLPEREWKSYMLLADTKLYRITNEKVIEKLQITQKEQDTICFYPASSMSGSSQQERKTRKAERARQLEERNNIINFFLDKQCISKDFAETANCSEATICRTLKKQGKKPYLKERRDRIIDLVRNGASISETAKLMAAPYSTVYSIVSEARKKGLLPPKDEAEKQVVPIHEAAASKLEQGRDPWNEVQAAESQQGHDQDAPSINVSYRAGQIEGNQAPGRSVQKKTRNSDKAAGCQSTFIRLNTRMLEAAGSWEYRSYPYAASYGVTFVRPYGKASPWAGHGARDGPIHHRDTGIRKGPRAGPIGRRKYQPPPGSAGWTEMRLEN